MTHFHHGTFKVTLVYTNYNVTQYMYLPPTPSIINTDTCDNIPLVENQSKSFPLKAAAWWPPLMLPWGEHRYPLSMEGAGRTRLERTSLGGKLPSLVLGILGALMTSLSSELIG